MYKINLQPEEQQLEGSTLLRLLDQWLIFQRTQLPPSTVDGYAVKLTYFRHWWERCGEANNWVVSRETFAQFKSWLANEARTKRDKPLSYHTCNDALRRLRQMFRWAKDFDRLPVDLSPWVPTPEGSAPLRVAPDIEAVEQMIAAAEASGPRDMAILAVFLGTGIRRAEAAGLDVTDVMLYADMAGRLTVRHAKRVKRRMVQARLVAFDAATGYYLMRWLDHLPPAGPLFPSSHVGREDERLTPQGIYKVIRRIVEDAGLQAVIQGPHDLRRLFATTFARHRRGAGFDDLLSRQLGHTTYAMTAHYVLSDVNDIGANLVTPLAIAKSGTGHSRT